MLLPPPSGLFKFPRIQLKILIVPYLFLKMTNIKEISGKDKKKVYYSFKMNSMNPLCKVKPYIHFSSVNIYETKIFKYNLLKKKNR